MAKVLGSMGVLVGAFFVGFLGGALLFHFENQRLTKEVNTRFINRQLQCRVAHEREAKQLEAQLQFPSKAFVVEEGDVSLLYEKPSGDGSAVLGAAFMLRRDESQKLFGIITIPDREKSGGKAFMLQLKN